MTKLYPISLLFISSLSVQAQSFIWAEKIGSTSFDIGSDIDTDSSGNTIVSGQFFGTTNVDTITLTSNGAFGTDAFLAKFNPSGNVLWAISVGGNGSDEITSIKTDQTTGEIYAVGTYSSALTIGSTTLPYDGTTSGTDVFLIKFSASGVPIWAKGFSGSSSDRGTDVIIDETNGFVYCSGTAFGTLNIDTVSFNAPTGTYYFLTKYSLAGQFQWARSYETSAIISSGFGGKNGGLGLLSSGDVIMGGNYRGSITFGGTNNLSVIGTNSFTYDAFLARISPSGAVAWTQTMGSIATDRGNDVVVDINDNIWITGIIGNTGIFGTITLSSSNIGVFLAKYNSSGTALFAYSGGGGAFNNEGYGVDADALGNIYLIGRYNSAITFGSNILTSPNFGSKLFISKYNDNLSQWDWAIGPDYSGSFSPSEDGRSIAVDKEDDVYVTGTFSGTMLLGATNLITSGSNDVFIAKIGDCSGLNASFSTTGSTSLCSGQTVTFEADTGQDYDYQWLFNGAVLPGQINTSYIANQSGNYTLVIDSLRCLDTATTVAVIINSSPTVTQSPLGSHCENATPFPLTGGSPSGGVYSGPGVSGGVFNPAVAGPGTHPIVYTFTNANGCSASVSVNIAVTPSPFVFMLPQPSVCQNTTPFALTVGIPGGGVYTGSGVSGGLVFNPAIAGIGTHKIFYTRTNGVCSTTDSVNITVNGVPSVSIGSFSAVCISTTFTPLTSGSPFGGVYSGPGVSSPFFFPIAAGVGTHPITYTVTQSGCSASATASLTVDPIPNPIMAPLPIFCDNDLDVNLKPYVYPAGGVFSGPAVVDSIFSPGIFGVGTDTIVYTITNACGSDTAKRSLTVQASPSVSLASFSSICLNDGVQPLSGGSPLGGTFSGAGVVGGTFNPIIAGAGSHPITYSFTNSNGCTDIATSSIVVHPIPIVSLSAVSSVCLNSGIQTLSGGLPAGGTYFGTGVTSGNFNPLIAGTGTHSIGYAFSDANGCSDTAFQNIVVHPLPIATLSAFANVCLNSGVQSLSGGLPAGGIYFGTGVTAGNFDPATAGVGTHQIGYSFVDGNSCADTANQNITIDSLPIVTLAPLTAFCIDAGVQTLIGGLPTGGTYFGTGVTGTSFDPATVGAGSHQIGYTFIDGNSCADTAFQNIVINPLPLVSLAPLSAVCIDAGIQTLSGGLPAGGSYFGTGVTAGIFDPAVAGIGAHQIGYAFSDANSCADTAYQSIVVDPLPTVTLSPLADVCVDAGSQVLSGGSPVGGIYFGTGVTAGNFDPATEGVGTHQIGYSFVDGNSCADTAYQNIKVDSLPIVTLAPLTAICIDAGVQTLIGGLPTGGTYFGMGVTGTSFDPATAGAGSHQIGYTFVDANSCADTAFQNIVINPLPLVSLAPLSAVCIDAGTQTLSGGLPAGGSYFGTGVTAGIFDPAVAGIGVHQIGYAFSDANSCADTAYQSIVVNPFPIVTLSPLADVCVDAGSQVLSGGSPVGGTYFGTGITSGNFNPLTAGAGTHSIGYTFSDANGCSDTAFQNIEVNPLPVVTLSAFADVCLDAGIQMLTGGFPTGGTYFGTGVTAGIFDPATATVGMHQIGYAFSDVNSCADTAFQNIVINPLPLVSLAPLSAVCIDAGTQTLSGGLPAGGSYFGTGVTAGIFDPAVAGIGAHQIGYAFSDANSCADTAYQSIVVDPLPTVTLSPLADVCVDAGSQVLSGGSPVGGIYFGTGVTAGNFDPATAGVGTHQIGYSFVDGNSCADTAYQNIKVDSLPIVTLAPLTAICIDAGVQTLIGGLPTGGTYFGTGVTGTSFDPATAGAGSHQIGYTFVDGNSCADTAFQNIVVNPLPLISLAPLSAVCIDAGIQTLSGGLPSGGTYFGTGVTGGNFNPSAAGAGTQSIGYSFTNGNGCSDTAFQNIVVHPLPIVTLSAFANVCLNSGVQTLSGGLPVGGTYFGTGITSGNFNPLTTGAGTHSIGYAFTNANGCSDTVFQNIVVNSLPIVSLAPLSAVCIDAGLQTLSGGLPSGGIYFGTGVLAGNFNPTVAGIGTHQIGYTFSNTNGCSDTAFQNISVNPLPVVSFNLNDSTCLNSNSISLSSGLPTGGIYSGSGVSGNSFSPSIAGLGTHQITYIFTNSNGCEGSAQSQIFVRNLPNIQFPSIADVCEDLEAFELPSALPLGGTYSSTGILLGSDSFDVLASGVGIFNVIYTFTNQFGCTNNSNQSFNVNALPMVAFDLPIDSVCEFTQIEILGQFPQGGIFTGIATIGDTIITDNLAFQQLITYTYTDSNACVNSALDSLWVYPDPGIQFSQNPLQLCGGEVISLDFADPIGGLFDSDFVDVLLGTLTAPDSIFTAIAGIYSFGNVCGFDSDTFYLDVSPNPIANLGNDTLICESEELELIPGSHFSYLWNDSSTLATFTVNDDNDALGVQNIWVEVKNNRGCTSSDSIEVEIAPQPVFDLGENIVSCFDSVILFSVDADYESFLWNTGATTNSIQAITGEGNDIIVPVYSVIASNQTGCSFMDSIALKLVDCDSNVVDPLLLDNIKIYPNPNRGDFVIELDVKLKGQLLSIDIYNMHGAIVKIVDPAIYDFEATLLAISAQELNSGAYVIVLETKDQTKRSKLIIE